MSRPATYVAVLAAVDDLLPWSVELLSRLVAIPSVTGEEAEAQALVASVMGEIGLDVDVWCPGTTDVEGHPSFSDDGLPLGDRPVVVGRWGGGADRPTLTINGHIDVVPPGDLSRWSADPWAGVVRDGFVHGRGACDMKGGLVAGLLAAAALRRAGVEPAVDILLQSVIGEESGGVGTLAALLRGHVGDAAIILEPTNMDMCPVGAGAASFRLVVRGRAAHGALRRDGVSAVDLFAGLLPSIEALEAQRHVGFAHAAFLDGSLVAPISIGRVVAGDWPSTVPESLVAEGRFGVLPGESLEAARAAMEQCVAEAARGTPWDEVEPPTVEWFEGQFASCATPLDAELLDMVGACHADVMGAPPAVRGVPYGSDLRFFTNDAGVPAVLYGPGDATLAHAVDERVAVDQVRDVAKVIALTVTRRPLTAYRSP